MAQSKESIDFKTQLDKLTQKLGDFNFRLLDIQNDVQRYTQYLKIYADLQSKSKTKKQKCQIVLQTEYSWLLDNLLPDEVTDYLYSWGILNDDQMDTIMCKQCRRDKCRALLDIITDKTPLCFVSFLKALDKSEQKHITDYLLSCMNQIDM